MNNIIDKFNEYGIINPIFVDEIKQVKNMYKVVALMGKAGAGKDTVKKEILNLTGDRYNNIISCTTRPMRENEVNGVDYYFMNRETFLSKKMFEVSEFRNWYYGISEESLSKDKINIGVFNPDGVRTFYGLWEVDLFIIYIDASDKVRLIRQLNREEYPDVKEIIRRFITDEEDFSNLNFDYFTVYNNEHRSITNLAGEIIDFIEGHKW